MARGQLDLLCAREPIGQVLEDASTPDTVRERLELVVHARRFAETLGLDVDEQYTHFAAWPGDRLVTTVVTTHSGELTPAGFWFPIVGRVPYKGYFDREKAEAEAARLRADGFDVCVSPVRAYSTLGWFADPVTGPMLRQPAGRLVETVFHELVHATVYAPDHADFNEGLATFVGEEARVAFYADHEGADAAVRERRAVEANRRLRAELERARSEIAALYDTEPAGPGRRAAREALEAGARERIAALPDLGDTATLSTRVRLNDACLAISGTYAGKIATWRALLRRHDGSLDALLARAGEAADGRDPLQALQSPP